MESSNNSNDNNDMKQQHELLILDGGTGREIEAQGGPFRQPEWSALALYEDPDIVRQVHESFIAAGANAITTNTYAIVPFHLGIDRYTQDSKRLLALAVDLAVQAVVGTNKDNDTNKKKKKNVLILGSIPPICGSYEPNKFDPLVAGPILHDFLDAMKGKVDALILETIGSIREAELYLSEIEIFQQQSSSSSDKLPVWLSFCIKTNHGPVQPPLLMSGETLTQAIQQLTAKHLLSQVSVVLVNCCDVLITKSCIQELRGVVSPTTRIGAYPNAFSIPPPRAANHTLRAVDNNVTPDMLRSTAVEWIQAGATVLGGCCGVGPTHIAAMASLRDAT
jgi:S-methylmethionine-dependent homocysteine/selenocysteine methylase